MAIQRIVFLAALASLLNWTMEARACTPFAPIAQPLTDNPSDPGVPASKSAYFATNSQLDLCDGNHDLSNVIMNLNISLVGSPNRDGSMGYSLIYQYYNGAGTYGGAQYLVFTFLDKYNTPLALEFTFSTQRGGCASGGVPLNGGVSYSPDPGIVSLYNQITAVSMVAGTVQGPQDPC
jgi:hypothetical protein